MKIDVYAMPCVALNSDEIVGYSFDVVMSHIDGKKTPLGEYNVSRKNKISGSINYEDKSDISSLNKIKDIIIGTGLDNIVAGAMNPRNYFWKTEITFPKDCDLSGSFDRAKELFDSDKVIKTTVEDYMRMMELSAMIDKEPEHDIRPYDGIYGRDEFDPDEYIYDNGDTSNSSSKRK